ncbi:histone H1-like [Rhinichthys klamathensis goyatoka]|uniref:histone H1-like n=1 Tax=Rhinichthys klamathensis goyatoka TaxID=3034132 RepID=UPI0024B56605|nr:histone H1-like [Rhinichthys klamathensis goyatoka]
MSAATAASSATKTPKRRSKAKKSGLSVSDFILKVLSSSEERGGGVSLVALKKALIGNGYDVVRNNSRIKLAVKRLVASGRLIQTKGTGASGSFRIGSKAVTKPKKAKAKRAKRKMVKKPAGTKKSPKKRRRNVGSPEKASETAAVKKTTRPKRAKRRASKSSKAKTA